MQNFGHIQFLTVLIQGSSFVAAFAAVTSSVIMYHAVQRFGKGILADGFRFIMAGLLFIALAIIIDAAQSYLSVVSANIYILLIACIKGLCFVAGTYLIVIGSHKTVGKLEALIK